jgi:hypothetical protein
MRKDALKILAMETLIEKCRIISAVHGRATDGDDPKAAGKECDTLVVLRKELRLRGGEGWQILCSLLRYLESGTRYWVARF